jgi:MFS family permease
VRHYLPASLQEVESWRLAFFVVAAPAPLFIALVFLTSLRRAGKPEAEPGQPDGLAMRTYLKRHGKPLGLVLFGATIFSFAFGGLIVWTPVAMARMFNATPAQNGAGLGLAIAAGSLIGIALGSILLPRLIKRLGRRAPVRVSWVAMLVGAPVVIAMPFVSAPWQAFLIVGEQMALSMMVGSLVPTMLQELAPAGLRARVVSFYTILSGAFGGLSVVAIGSLSDGVNEPRGLLLAVVATAIPAWIVAAAFMRAAESPFEISASEIALQELSASREL